MNYAFLSTAVVLNVAAYAILRSIAQRPHDVLWLLLFSSGLLLGAANVFCFTAALKHMRLAVAYPVFSGATIALMVITSALAFGERITYTMVGGCAVIIVGIALLSKQ